MSPVLMAFVDHLTRGFTPELAEHFVKLPQPDKEFQSRLDELAAKANSGRISPDEADEYSKISEYMDFVALLRVKARSRLAAQHRQSSKIPGDTN